MNTLLLGLAMSANLLQLHVQERREARLAGAQPPATYRMGRNILPDTVSPRRRAIVQFATVIDVQDGSIMTVRQADGTQQEIRLLGVEAPEVIRDDIECFARESRDALRALVLGKLVTLERDVDYQRDSYKRLVRYVRLNGQDVNAWMLWHGYAFSDTNLDHDRTADYDTLEAQAKEAERGLWSYHCDYNKNVKTVPVLQ